MNSLLVIIDSIEELYRYRQQKTLYECECMIKSKRAELRRIDYQCQVVKERELILELSKCKMKYNLLKEQVIKDECYKLFEPLLNELEERIEELRQYRNCL